MKSLTINQQKSANEKWQDEAGDLIPYNRVRPYERLAERKLATMARKALGINESLTAFKKEVQETAEELYEAFLLGNNGKAPGKGKGGITLFNFDRSIKVEVTAHDKIEFDPNLIGLAKAELDELLKDGLGGAKEWIEPLVMSAFETSNGRMDHKKILSLKKHSDRITDERFHKAMAFIDKAIRRPSSKEYFRVWIRKNNGEYQDIQLNFSAIEVED